MRDERIPAPLVLIGVDGLEWRLVLDMAKDGRLPELSRLASEGSAARLETLEPAFSPPIWTSIATGVVPARHGIAGFTRPDPHETWRTVLFTNRDRQVKAIWNIATDAGRKSCTVGYWETFPVELDSGLMIAQTALPAGQSAIRKGALESGTSGQVEPLEYEDRAFELAKESARDASARALDLFGDTSTWPVGIRRIAAQSRWSLAADAAYERISLDLLRERGRCDLVIVYLGIADVVGHRFWRWTYPDDFAEPPPPDEVERFGDVLPRAYAQVDAFVGRVREAAGPDATIVVASDHGMGPFRPKSRVATDRADGPLIRTGGHSAKRLALLVAAGPGIRNRRSALPLCVDAQAGSILDVAPTLLALLGLPRGADMDGHVLRPILDDGFVASHPLREIPTHTPADWPRTRRLAEAEDPGASERIEQLRGLGYVE